MRFATTSVAVRAGYVLATFLFTPLVSYADPPPPMSDFARDDATLNNQHVALPPADSYRTESPHRLSRGCGFHFDNIEHGLGC
jgi:hypothetical protein